MGFWIDRIVVPVMDWSLGTPAVGRLREEALAPARGRVLEIGFGSGLSLPFYPPAVEEIVGLDSGAGRRARAEESIARWGRAARFQLLDAQRLPFDDGSFDTVASCFTMCSIDDLGAALREIRRVLRPGGQLLFLEHGLSPEPGIQRLQRLFSPVNELLSGGCRMVREPLVSIAAGGLELAGTRSFYFDEAPRPIGWFSLGRAVRPSAPPAP